MAAVAVLLPDVADEKLMSDVCPPTGAAVHVHSPLPAVGVLPPSGKEVVPASMTCWSTLMLAVVGFCLTTKLISLLVAVVGTGQVALDVMIQCKASPFNGLYV